MRAKEIIVFFLFRYVSQQFRHRDFTFERRIYVDCGKRLSTSPIQSPNPAKKICLESNSSNNLCDAADDDENDRCYEDERVFGVVNLASLYRQSFVNLSTKDLISIAFEMDMSFSLDYSQTIELESRHRLHLNEWKKLQVGRICGSVFKDGNNKSFCSVRFGTFKNIFSSFHSLVCHSQAKHPSKLLNQICRRSRVEDASHQWLRKNFLTVRSKYERIMLNRHKNFAYRKCGLILRPEHPQFCVTPGEWIGHNSATDFFQFKKYKKKSFPDPHRRVCGM